MQPRGLEVFEKALTQEQIVDIIMAFIDSLNGGIRKPVRDNAPFFHILHKKFYNQFRTYLCDLYFAEPDFLKDHYMFSVYIGNLLIETINLLTVSDIEAIKQEKLTVDSTTNRINGAGSLKKSFLVCTEIEPRLLAAQESANAYVRRVKLERRRIELRWAGDNLRSGLRDEIRYCVGWNAENTLLCSYDAYDAVKDYLLASLRS